MDKQTVSILKFLYDNTDEHLNCDIIASRLNYDKENVQNSMLYLRNHGYVHTNDITQRDNSKIHPDSFYKITVEGKGCYEDICRNKLHFVIPIIISNTIAAAALAISIISLMK